MILNISGTILIITFIINLFLAFLVLLKNFKSRINISFSILLFAIAFWNLTHIFTDVFTFNTHLDMLFWSKMFLLGPIFIPAILLYFSLIFPNIFKQLSLIKTLFVFLPSIILLFFIFTGYNVKSVVTQPWGLEFQPGELYILFTIYFIIFITITLYNFYRSYKISSSIEREQLKYIFLGVATACFIGIFTNSILPLLGHKKFNIYGAPISLFFTITVSYSILRYRFMDMKDLFVKTLVRVISFIILIFFCYLLLFILNYFFRLNLVVIISSTAIISYVWMEFVERFFIKYLIESKYSRKSIENIKISGVEIDELISQICSEVKRSMNSVFVEFFLLKKAKNFYEQLYPGEKITSTFIDDELIKYFKRNRRLLVADEIPFMTPNIDEDTRRTLNEINRKMKILKSSIALPIFFSKELFGLILLGPKKDQKLYTVEDFKFLEELSNNISLVLGNVIIYSQAATRVKNQSD